MSCHPSPGPEECHPTRVAETPPVGLHDTRSASTTCHVLYMTYWGLFHPTERKICIAIDQKKKTSVDGVKTRSNRPSSPLFSSSGLNQTGYRAPGMRPDCIQFSDAVERCRRIHVKCRKRRGQEEIHAAAFEKHCSMIHGCLI